MKRLTALTFGIFLAFLAGAQITTNPTVTGRGTNLATQVTGVLGAVNGGLGVANNAAATLTRSGSHALTITTTGTTGVTLPTTGTLATTAGNVATATALAADPTDCGANTFATTIAASGNLTCAQPAVTNLSDYTGSTVWTPADGSGAGLSLTVTSARYTKIGPLVKLSFDITYPVTADATSAVISGLPITTDASVSVGATTVNNAGGVLCAKNNGSTTTLVLVYCSLDTAIANSALSTKVLRGSIVISQ